MTNGGEIARAARWEARRGSLLRSAGVRAAGVFLSALAASCSSRPEPVAPQPSASKHARCAAFEGGETPRARPISLVARSTDARGVRHYVLSDGSELALDPLEPFTLDRQRDFPKPQEPK